MSNLKNSRSLRVVVALIIPFAIFCYIYTFNPISTSIPAPSSISSPSVLTSTSISPQSLETTTISTSTLTSTATTIASSTSEPAAAKPTYTLPDKVWHSAKFDNLTQNQRQWTGSWTQKNPALRQELLTDRSAEAFVRAHFNETRPDIVEVYEGLQIPILRADLFRYLVVLAEGGIWGDLDVTCEKEVNEWVPAEYRNQNIDMIVGLEFDMQWRGEGSGISSQFCNWVFVGRKSSRNLQVIVDTVVKTLKDIAETNSVGIDGIILEMLSDVVEVTGPKIMTIAILEGLGKLLGKSVDDRDFAGIKQPKLIGDVLIMPGVSFAALQNGNPTDQGDALVTHNYEGSWKKEDADAKERKKQKEIEEQQQAQHRPPSKPPTPPPAPAPAPAPET